MLEDQKAEAQQTLDELFSAQILLFKLCAYRVEPIGSEEYIVRFHDSRLPSVDVSCPEGQCFKDVFRTAVLERTERLCGHRNTALYDLTA